MIEPNALSGTGEGITTTLLTLGQGLAIGVLLTVVAWRPRKTKPETGETKWFWCPNCKRWIPRRWWYNEP